MRSRRVGGLILVAIWFAACSNPFEGEPHLPDAQLIANFQAHKEDFETIRVMIIVDKGLTRVGNDFTYPENPGTIGVSSARIAEYRRMFRRLGVAEGLSTGQDRIEIELLASCQGWVSHGSDKGYVYSETPPKPLLDSLDNLSSADRPIGHGYRHIDGNWYLCFNGD